VPYATPSDLTTYFDASVIADLARDDGQPAPDLSNTTTEPAIINSLSAASGQINAAVLVAAIYSVTDLGNLTGDDKQLLTEICCTLAMAKLIRRRPEKYGSEAYQAFVKDSEEYLDRLRKGERLFNLPAPIDAGLPIVDGPTAVTMDRLNLITTRTKNFFPLAARRLPIGR
jgi:hypothetical protein